MTPWPIPKALVTETFRVLGYPDTLSSASLQLGYPGYASQYALFQPYAVLQNKINVLAGSPEEAVPIYGQAHAQFASFYLAASFALALATPSSIAPGAQLSVSVSGNPVTVAAANGETPTSLAAKLAVALNGNGAVSPIALASPSANTATIVALAAGAAGNGVPIVATSSDPSLTVNGAQVAAAALAGGQNPPGPTLTLSPGNVIFGYLPIIQQLEDDLGGGRKFLTFAKAGVAGFRLNELDERGRLLNRYRRELADRFGVPLDPDVAGNRGGRRLLRRI